jgi:hypothetical protein
VEEVIGEEVPDERALAAIHDEVVRDGVPEEDRYNLWYVQHCAAVEQPNYDEEGKARQDKEGQQKVLDAGHSGMRLRDFVDACNAQLQKSGSEKRVTDAQVLALRLYTGSTFRRFNTALREKGMGQDQGEMPFRACVQSARKGVLTFQAIKRPTDTTFRGVTGFLPAHFGQERIGMDYAFFSTSVDRGIGREFAGSAAISVLFEVKYVAGCPGADISMLSLYPGEKEVLFAPCTGLSLEDSGAGVTGPNTGASAGQAEVAVVSPTPAMS